MNDMGLDVLDELKEQLRQLPPHLRDEGGDIVETAARWAHNEIKVEYDKSKDTGNLVDHLKLEVKPTTFGSGAVVKSTAKHAHLFEDGSAVRKTKKGYNRGFMPAANIFVPIVIRRRRWMHEQLIALLERAGLTVEGTP